MAKINKDQLIQLRCTKAFKAQLAELAEINDMTISKLIIKICNDKIRELNPTNEKQLVIQKEVKPSELPFKLSPQKSLAELQQKIGVRVLAMRDEMTDREIAEILNNEGLTNTNGSKWDKQKVKDFARRLTANLK